jgi:hypothetical protein
MRNDRNPYIFSCQTLAHLPSFVEDSDGAIRLDLANEVEPSSCNRHGLGQMQDLFGSQTTNVFALLCLLRRDIAQEWWCMIGHIPMDEGRTGATNLRSQKACPHKPFNSSTSPLHSGWAMGKKISSMPRYKHSRTNCPKMRGVL